MSATNPQSNPVAILGERRRALYAEAEALAAAVDKRPVAALTAADQIPVNEAWGRVKEIERQMIGLVATTPEGIAAQAEILRDFVSVSEYEPLLEQIIAGLRRLAAGGAT